MVAISQLIPVAKQKVMPLEVLQISNNSINSTFGNCPRRFEFAKLFDSSGGNWEPSLPGDAGNALHTGMQHYMLTGDRDHSIWQFMRAYPISLCKSVNDQRSLQACYATLLAMMDAKGFESYSLAYIEHHRVNKPAIEVPFAINILRKDGTPFTVTLSNGKCHRVVYIGFMDLILYDAFADTYIVCDIKTTRKARNDYTSMFKYDSQCLPYALILERMLSRSFDNLLVKYLVAYIDIKEPTAHMYPFRKTRLDVTEWGQDLSIKLRELALYSEMQWFPRRGAACDTWGICSYFDMCDERDPQVIEEHLAMAKSGRGKEKNPRPAFEPWLSMDLVLEGI